MQEETVFIETLDGIVIESGVLRCDVIDPQATVIIGHPHPLYGGDRFNHVVTALQHGAWENNCHSITVNFRGVGSSGGEHDNGDAERLDLAAACELAEMIAPTSNIIMAGYSFGALVALNVTHPLISAWIAVAPPLSPHRSAPTASSHHRPKFLYVPEHDQFATTDLVRELTSTWALTTVHSIDNVDHSIVVGAKEMAQQAICEALSASV